METKKINSESLQYFLNLSSDMLSETNGFLFDLMAETARAEHLTREYKEEKIYFITQLHQLFSGMQEENKNLSDAFPDVEVNNPARA